MAPHRTVRGATACLAALLTLLSGTPHLDCLCADGHIKLFCLNLGPKSSPCCRAGRCCPTHGAKTSRRSCCSHGRQARKSAPASQVSTPGCKKVLTHAKAATLPEPAAAPHLTSLLAIPALAAGVVPPADAWGYRLFWQSYHQPPPPDLVIALRHLTI